MEIPEPIYLIISSLFLFNISITVFEWCYDKWKKNNRQGIEDRQSLILGFIYVLIEELGAGAIGYLALVHLEAFQLFDFSSLPLVLSWGVSILLADLTYYWMHRIEHFQPFLWGVHAVHHNSKEYNLITGYRLSLFEHFVEWIFLAPLVCLGFSATQVVGSIILVAMYQHWIHTKHIPKISWMQGWINNPSCHRVHHASNPGKLDKNFGGIFLFWDRLFGTYQAEDFDVEYGITRPVDPKSLFDTLVGEWHYQWSEKNGSKDS